MDISCVQHGQSARVLLRECRSEKENQEGGATHPTNVSMEIVQCAEPGLEDDDEYAEEG